MIWAVIMAGGQGTRFWPLSSLDRPKQLLPLVTEKTMLEETVARLGGFISSKQILIVTNARQAPLVRALLPRIPKQNILAEPCGRNTAPCVGLAALLVRKRDSDGIMVVIPADQMISRKKEFLATLRCAVRFAEKSGVHVTIGIKPAFAATGFGWIEAGKRISGNVFQVRRFVEKPALPRATKMLRSKRFSWNSGMFIWRADTVLDSIRKFLPDIYRGLQRIKPAVGTARFNAQLKKFFPKLRSISIDYGVMEKAPRAVVIRADVGFNDVGSWDTASVFWPKDKSGNAVHGELIAIDSHNNVIFNEIERPVACIGVEGLTIISAPAGVLVCDSQRSQDIKHIQSFIKRR
ncbi:MAG: mannose-1-phosphate guanylyltransferase [Candidatus Omnitrophica bacterium]|nr:mannose-1-phosphate guanylyltransferase [Candidatus Omnitrophota bacterium]